jgi:sugar lactone lactonase YvrE
MGIPRRTARRRVLLVLALVVVSIATMSANSDARRWAHGKARHWFFHVFYRPDSPQDLGDGRLAAEIVLHSPMGLAEDADGNLYVTDRSRFFGGYLYRGQVVWKIGPDGRAWIIAGTGYKGDSPTGIPARDADLGTPEGVAADGSGRIYVADSNNNLVLRIEADGTLSRFAGTGDRGYGGDGGPATKARLNQPYDVRLAADGSLYVADYGNHRIRRIAPDGMITTVAGTGEPGYAGDGGPAAMAQLRGPYGILVGEDGRLLIADSENNVVRMVDAAGIISTIAGTGEQGFSGDGGPALSARLNYPESLAIDHIGRIYVGDEHNSRVRLIELAGTIDTFLGTGEITGCPEGSPRTKCAAHVQNMVIRADGSMLATDRGGRRVILVAPDGAVTTFASIASDDVDSK